MLGVKRSTWYAWHSWLGLITGIFMVLIGFSGAVAVFKHEIDWMVTPSLRVSGTGPLVPVDSLYASLKWRFPDGKVDYFYFRQGPRSAHVAYVKDSSGQRYQVHLHPYTGAVTGVRPTGGYTWSLQNFIRQFHVRLLMGYWGRIFVGFFGVTLFLSCLTGLFVYRRWFKTLFSLRFRPKASQGWRLWISDWHKSVGLMALLFNLLLAATGAVLGLENLYRKAVYDWMGLPRQEGLLLSENLRRTVEQNRRDSLSPLPPSRLLEQASREFPDMAPTGLFPASGRRPFEIWGDHPAHVMASGRSRVIMDPRDGRVLKTVDAREKPFWDRLYDTFDPLHFGYFAAPYGETLEYAVKILWCLLGLTPGLLSLSGFWLWYSRMRARTRNRTGKGKRQKRQSPSSYKVVAQANGTPQTSGTRQSKPVGSTQMNISK